MNLYFLRLTGLLVTAVGKEHDMAERDVVAKIKKYLTTVPD